MKATPGAKRCKVCVSQGKPRPAWAIAGGEVCRGHGGSAPQVMAKAAVRAEVLRWGLGDSDVDPGEVLLRMVSQSAARADFYAGLLQEAYVAADLLGGIDLPAGVLTRPVDEPADYEADDEGGVRLPPPDVQRARLDLERVFSAGGVSALVGKTYAAAGKDGFIFAASEGIRALVQLEASERDRCVNFAAKAVAAGLAERQVRLAERQGEIIAEVIRGVLAELDVDTKDLMVAQVVRRHLQAVS